VVVAGGVATATLAGHGYADQVVLEIAGATPSALNGRQLITATGSGTATTFTTPVAGQGIWASFHVTSVTGTGTITFTIQTDDNSGFSSSTTRLTATAMAAVGGQFATAATGALAGETHIRVGYAISGFTSVTFFAAAGVA
jgi:hypothetical protein